MAKRQQVLKFITDYVHDYGIAPSLREIGNGTGIRSTSAVAYNLRKLETEGYIERFPKIPRGIKLVQGSTPCLHCTAAVAEAAARQAAIEYLCDVLAPGQDGSYRRLAAFMRKEAHEIVLAVREPSPAVAALERRLAEAAQLEEEAMELRAELSGAYMGGEVLRERLAPMPCGHPGACVVSADGGTGHCGWCEDVAKGADEYNALFELWERAEALAALVPELREQLTDTEAEFGRFSSFAIKTSRVARHEMDELHEQLAQATALIPPNELLKDLILAVSNESQRSYGEGAQQMWQDVEAEARALAASIEEARREQKQEGENENA